MKECRFCKHANREGFFFCEDCGQPLAEDKPTTVLTTQKIDEEAYEWRTSYGTAEFKPGASILLRIVGTSTPLVLKPAEQITIGRLDAEQNITPDVDLTPYSAVEKGVSRIHAIIIRSEDGLLLIDKGSANGTHLNGQRLVAQQPRVLRDGDEIRLGKLVARIFFNT